MVDLRTLDTTSPTGTLLLDSDPLKVQIAHSLSTIQRCLMEDITDEEIRILVAMAQDIAQDIQDATDAPLAPTTDGDIINAL